MAPGGVADSQRRLDTSHSEKHTQTSHDEHTHKNPANAQFPRGGGGVVDPTDGCSKLILCDVLFPWPFVSQVTVLPSSAPVSPDKDTHICPQLS